MCTKLRPCVVAYSVLGSWPTPIIIVNLVHAHPALVMHMCDLFRSMILHGFVPDDFGCGLMVPLLKEKTGAVSS